MMLIEKVRAATQSLHQALDHSLIPRIENIRSKSDYAALLLQFYGFFKPVYDSIDAHIDINFLPDYYNRRKPGCILNDLKDLEINYTLRFCQHLPVIHDNASAFGALYVLEGSTLGGMVIRKMIGSKLHTDKGLSFFNGYGRQTREQWKIFIHALNNLDNNNPADEVVIKTALATFTFFKNWIEQAECA